MSEAIFRLGRPRQVKHQHIDSMGFRPDHQMVRR